MKLKNKKGFGSHFFATALIFVMVGCGGAKSGDNNTDTEQFGNPSVDYKGETTPLWDLNGVQNTWTVSLYNAIDTDGADLINNVPDDATTFCPNYQNLSNDERKQYWAFLISAMSFFESSFNTKATYPANVDSSNTTAARGLLQLSLDSTKSYDCPFSNNSDLHDPVKNLTCGVLMMNRLIGQDNRIAGQVNAAWKGGARYWAVLRSTNPHAYQSIVYWTSHLNICH